MTPSYVPVPFLAGSSAEDSVDPVATPALPGGLALPDGSPAPIAMPANSKRSGMASLVRPALIGAAIGGGLAIFVPRLDLGRGLLYGTLAGAGYGALQRSRAASAR